MVLFYPRHVTKELTDNTVISFGHLQLNHNKSLLRIECQNVNEPSAHRIWYLV